ncbi:hypothetical protein [Metamycoplasma equirhinis]|uniref:hypothetical protein n=1 Tax=Metamycoplasma equirhinis TaxID=92402 RepID=UPI00359434FE
MELFVETSLSDLYIAIIKNNKIIDKICEKDLVKKTDEFYLKLNLLFERNKIDIDSINEIYITLGPGSFSGARIGLLFARTICQISNKKLFIVPTYKLFEMQKKMLKQDFNQIKIKANKYNNYLIKLNSNFSCELVENNNDFDKFDYQLFEKKLPKYKNIFMQCLDVNEVELLYLHEPQIGGK